MNEYITSNTTNLVEYNAIQLNEYKIAGLEFIKNKFQFILNSDENYWYYLDKLAIEVFGSLEDRDGFYRWAIENRYVNNPHQPIEELSSNGKAYLRLLIESNKNKKDEIIVNNVIIENSIDEYIDVEFLEIIDGKIT